MTNYTGSVRVRVAYHFDRLCRAFLLADGAKALEHVACRAMLALHATADTLTEPGGSLALFERAACERKTLVLISGPDGEPGLARTSCHGVVSEGLAGGKRGSVALQPGGDAVAALEELKGLNMWHSITTEPGCEKVSHAVAAWILEEAARPAAKGGTPLKVAAPSGSKPPPSPPRPTASPRRKR